jgi:RecB family exonuclease
VAVAEARAEAARQLREGWIRLAEAASAWPAAESWAGWVSLLQQRLCPLLGRSKDWSSFMQVLDSLSQLDAVARTAGVEQRVPFGRMVSTLEESIRRFFVPAGRLGRSGVNLIGISAARGLRFPLVIVAGLEEGRFPARLRQDPLLLDGERGSIGEPARLPLKSLRGDEEKLLFDMAVRSAGRRLVLAASRLDEETDREILPSEFFLRAVSATAGRMLAAREVTEAAVPAFRSVSLENPAPRPGLPAVDDGEILLRLITAVPAERRTAVAALSRRLPELLAGPVRYLESRWVARLTPYDGRIFDSRLASRIAHDFGPSAGPVSASRIEEYAACPYRFFLKRVMGLERWEEAEAAETLDPLERGIVVHAILERFMRQFRGERFTLAAAEELQKSLLAEARPLLEEARPAGIPALLWEIERERLEALLAGWLEFEMARRADGLLPDLFEFSFGTFDTPGAAGSLTVRGGSHSFEFRGRIDRVDRSPDGGAARVIDYKTGRFPTSLNKLPDNPLMGGERVQIAVYREALRQLDESGGPKSATGEYLHLDPQQRKAVQGLYSDELLREAANKLPALLEVVGDGMTGGIFFRRTQGLVWGDGNCSHCDFPSVCGRDRQARTEHKAGDPEVIRLTSLSSADPGYEEEQ